MLSRTRVTAPIDGFVVSGDLSQMLGAPVERGRVLFEIAPLSSYRVILQVDERDIRYVSVDQSGTLALTGIPDAQLGVTISNITSIATADEGRNYFRVEATLDDGDEKLRPGMEGVVRLTVGERKLAWIWTHDMLEWLQLTWWAWKPL
jgi:multidrug efflux pump subunit AcrA (membrane-fusion protein)